jgi:hypothetical protein
VSGLVTEFPAQIAKPSRGLFMPVSGGAVVPPPLPPPGPPPVGEDAFYEPFAEWLKNDLDEVTVARRLGGGGLRGKWGTPDVVGVYRPLAAQLIKFQAEIVTAEIKVDPAQPVVAFGQAVAYRLFSTKTYVVMPESITEEDLSRLESLCALFGIGLVLFKPDPSQPNFTIRVRAQRFLPDMFYVNEFADRLRQHDGQLFESLFG